MAYTCYYETINKRWQGSGVPGECDYLGCYEEIDRGMSFKCVGDCDCGLFFCYEHQGYIHDKNSSEAKSDTIDWLERIITDEQWESFRAEYPAWVERYRELVEDY